MADPDDEYGLAADLTGIKPIQPPGLAATLAPSAMVTVAPQAGAIPPEPAVVPIHPRLTDSNVQKLGTILSSECGDQKYPCTPQEIQAVGSSVINRMNQHRTDDVHDVSFANGKPQYAMGKEPSQGMLFTAARLLTGQLGDNTGGATNFYSPRSMPLEGKSTEGFDVGGGLEYVPGEGRATKLQNYRPDWVQNMQQRTIPGVRDWYLKVYGPP